MDFKGTINNIAFSFDGKQLLTFETAENVREIYDTLNGKELNIEVKQYRRKRSLNANGYAWALINDMANILRIGKDEMYLELLKRYGQSEIISVKAGIDLKYFVKYFEKLGESNLNGSTFAHYKVFKGSSEFDTREMAIFLDGVIDEAKALGIRTETPQQIEELKALWSTQKKE